MSTAARAAAPPRSARLVVRMSAWVWDRRHGIATFVVLFLSWEFLTWLAGVPEYLLPRPSIIARELTMRWARVSANVGSTR